MASPRTSIALLTAVTAFAPATFAQEEAVPMAIGTLLPEIAVAHPAATHGEDHEKLLKAIRQIVREEVRRALAEQNGRPGRWGRRAGARSWDRGNRAWAQRNRYWMDMPHDGGHQGDWRHLMFSMPKTHDAPKAMGYWSPTPPSHGHDHKHESHDQGHDEKPKSTPKLRWVMEKSTKDTKPVKAKRKASSTKSKATTTKKSATTRRTVTGYAMPPVRSADKKVEAEIRKLEAELDDLKMLLEARRRALHNAKKAPDVFVEVRDDSGDTTRPVRVRYTTGWVDEHGRAVETDAPKVERIHFGTWGKDAPAKGQKAHESHESSAPTRVIQKVKRPTATRRRARSV